MMAVSKHLRSLAVVAICCALVAEACGDARRSLVSPDDGPGLFAKAPTTTVTVKAANPGFGDQGQIGELVTITGTGFKPGATPAWLRNGVVDGTIHVTGSSVLNSTTITATINIDANSPLDFRDIQVSNSDRTQGIGDAVFEVTQARLMSGTMVGRAVNDNGEVVGALPNGGAFYYDISTGVLDTVSTSASADAFSISPLGNAIVGSGAIGSKSGPALYTRSGPVGSSWSVTLLPVGPNAIGGDANSMVTDPVTGQVTLIGGAEALPTVHGCPGANPIIWSWQASTNSWVRHALPNNGACISSVWPRGLSVAGTAVGRVDGTAAVWTPTNSGGYTLTLLDGDYAYGINANATMIVGENGNGTHAIGVYWVASGAGWTTATAFPGGCGGARDVADFSGRVTLNNCPFGSNSLTYAAYMDAPYTTPMKLGGVGGHNNNFIGGISPSGAYMVGYGFLSAGTKIGVFWKP